MFIDYLRYIAFEGRLRHFFNTNLENYVEPRDTTGQHLRFSPQYLARSFDRYGGIPAVFRDLYCNSPPPDVIYEELCYRLGICRHSDAIDGIEQRLGGSPPTSKYSDRGDVDLQIIVDIDPKRWHPRYDEAASYENVSIVYRRAGVAFGRLKSGDKVYDQARGQARYGTLCGLFRTLKEQHFALTCGHVAAHGSLVEIERPRRWWWLPVARHQARLGWTIHHETCPPRQVGGKVKSHLDAALIQVEGRRGSPGIGHEAVMKPLSTMLQEAPVVFRGGGRGRDTLGRISALTVRKSIDLYREGQLREVGDVLMLGHRYPMYVRQPLSRPGDSGAAVRQGLQTNGPFNKLNEWYGMILGGDDTGAFATYAEQLWSWAAETTGDSIVSFDFEA